MFCSINFEGRLVKEVEIKTNTYGEYTFFTLAFNKSFKDKDGNWQEKTTFVPCFSQDTFALNRLKDAKKGSKLLVSGAFATTKKENEYEKLLIKIVKIYDISEAKGKQPENNVQNDVKEDDDVIPF